jgi:hypothetical protein
MQTRAGSLLQASLQMEFDEAEAMGTIMRYGCIVQ